MAKQFLNQVTNPSAASSTTIPSRGVLPPQFQGPGVGSPHTLRPLAQRPFPRFHQHPPAPASSSSSSSSSSPPPPGGAQFVGFEKFAPKEFCASLDEHIIGQSHAKRMFAVGVYNHLKRVAHNSQHTPSSPPLSPPPPPSPSPPSPSLSGLPASPFGESIPQAVLVHPAKAAAPPQTGPSQPAVEIEKSNVLVFGPTGCGKTLFAKSLAKYLGVPFVIADATCLTQAGYVGDDVESILTKLLVEANGNVQACERGIVYLDEIDKLSVRAATHTTARDVAGEGVQQALLKMLEGSVVSVPSKLGKKDQKDFVTINTSNILFIAGGAFSGLHQVLAQRLNARRYGFAPSRSESKLDAEWEDNVPHAAADEARHNAMLRAALPRDFVEYGLIPEFMGRFPVLVPLQSLTVDELARVLTEPRNALVKQYSQLFAMSGVDLQFAPGALRAVAREAKEIGTGARGLRAVLERVLLQPSFELDPSTKHKQLMVSEEMVAGGPHQFVDVAPPPEAEHPAPDAASLAPDSEPGADGEADSDNNKQERVG